MSAPAALGAGRLAAGEHLSGRGSGEVVPVAEGLSVLNRPVLRRGLAWPHTRGRPAIGDEPEKVFQRRVVKLAELYGWVVWHTLDSTGTRAGEPDLRLCRPPRYILAELKSEHGKLRLEQAQALTLLEQCPGIETYLWRPSHWADIVEVLRR